MTNGRIIKLNIVLFLLIIVLSVGIIASTELKNVSIEGLTRYEAQEFYDMLGHEGIYSNTLAFWTKNKINKKKDIPFIEKYYVTLIDKNTVEISVFENEVVGCIEVMGSYFCFDKDGFITESTSERPAGVPSVTGLDYYDAVIFKQLKIRKQSLFEVVLNITKLLKKYGIPIKEISFNSFNEVTLYGENLEVLLGKRKEYDTPIAALKGVYEKANEIGGIVDMRNYNENNTNIVLKTFPKQNEKEIDKTE